jgi:hypothetical protein
MSGGLGVDDPKARPQKNFIPEIGDPRGYHPYKNTVQMDGINSILPIHKLHGHIFLHLELDPQLRYTHLVDV